MAGQVSALRSVTEIRGPPRLKRRIPVKKMDDFRALTHGDGDVTQQRLFSIPPYSFTYSGTLSLAETSGCMYTDEAREGCRHQLLNQHTHTHTQSAVHMLILQGMGEFRASLISSAGAYH